MSCLRTTTSRSRCVLLLDRLTALLMCGAQKLLRNTIDCCCCIDLFVLDHQVMYGHRVDVNVKINSVCRRRVTGRGDALVFSHEM